MPAMSRKPTAAEISARELNNGGINTVLGIEDQSLDSYHDIMLIGTGAYGTVYRARDSRTGGTFVALKKVRVQVCEDGMPISTVREIALLRKLEKFEHPNLVKLLDVCCPNQTSNREMTLTLIFEYIEQDLSAFISQCPPPGLPLHLVKDLMRQMFHGLDFLHANKIVHRDLKPQNLLLARGRQLKIADFGLARLYSFSMVLTSVVVTLWYRAPEVLLQARYASPVDMWSCGCIFVEMCTKRPLFAGQSDIDMLHKIFGIIGLPDACDWPGDITLPRSAFAFTPRLPFDELVPELDSTGKDLLEKLLHFNPGERLTAAGALAHPYFAGMDDAASSPDVQPPGSVGSISGTSSLDSSSSTGSTADDIHSGYDTPASK